MFNVLYTFNVYYYCHYVLKQNLLVTLSLNLTYSFERLEERRKKCTKKYVLTILAPEMSDHIAKYTINAVIDLTGSDNEEWPATQAPFKVVKKKRKSYIQTPPPHSTKRLAHSTETPPHCISATKSVKKAKFSKNEYAPVVDWMDVSSDEDDITIYEGDCREPLDDLPDGWFIQSNPDKEDPRFIYRFPEFSVKVKGSYNMFVADNKIRYWKKKYQKKVKCEFCKQKPCCLDGGMKSLLQDRGEDLQNVISIDNKATRYQLYHTAARCFFGYLGWGNRKELPKCIVDYIRYLYPKKDTEKYSGFVPEEAFYNASTTY